MSEFYFAKFPTFEYNGLKCRDITRRVNLSKDIEKNPVLFYPYEIESGMRADVLAHHYYKDSYMDWLIYHTNGIIDPYYDWYLSEQDFDAFVTKKYGSLEEANRRVKYYELNWGGEEDFDISTDHYDRVIPEVIKKYWTPVFGNGSRIQSYTKRKEEWIVNTNKILKFDITMDTDTEFANGELVNTKLGGEIVGRVEIIVANTTEMIVQHISGNTSANNLLLNSLNTEANAVMDEKITLSDVISDEEFAYWTPVTMWEWERQKNETNKNLYLMDAGWSLAMAEQLRLAMKET